MTILNQASRTIMKSLLRLSAAVLLVVTTQSSHANIVGYVNATFDPGSTLFANPLDNGSGNTLSTLFSTNLTAGTTVSLWNPTSLSFDTTSTFDLTLFGGWEFDLSLNPGTGALFQSPIYAPILTNTFIGNVLNHDGSLLDQPEDFALPPAFSGPDGIYLFSDKAPVGGSVSNFFLNVIGRDPNDGEQVITLSGSSTYMSGSWSTPLSLSVGESAFFNLGPSDAFDPLTVLPVPEPSQLPLLLLGFALLIQHSRRRRS